MAHKNVIRCDAATLAKDISGKTYIVTGANSGIGLETTRQLVKQGGHVVMACRRVEAGEAEAKSFAGLKGSYEVMHCDLADLQSVRNFVDAFKKKYNRLDGLACNAGVVIWGNKAQYTKDGLEKTMGISYLGHFLMTELLLDMLKKSDDARYVILSSVIHANNTKQPAKVNFEDINWKTRKYNAEVAYAEAKVATVLYAKELGERLKDTNVSAYSVHPGWARSNFGKGTNPFMTFMINLTRPLVRSMSDSSEDSAQTSLHCLLSDDALKHSGAYFSQHSVLYNDKQTKKGGWPMVSPNPNARDMGQAKRLVEMSYELVGLK